MPIILASQDAEMRRITVQSQPGKQFARPYLEKKPSQKKGLVECLKVQALSSIHPWYPPPQKKRKKEKLR
jgi:hypothetical protein